LTNPPGAAKYLVALQRKGAVMANTYLVDLDLAQLRAHRSRVENRPLSDDEVRSWLLDFGFYPRMDGLYLAEDAVLRQLEPSQVIAARKVGHLLH
jgi:hypothetical protein